MRLLYFVMRRLPTWVGVRAGVMCAAVLMLTACGGGGGGGEIAGTNGNSGTTAPSGTGNSEQPVRPIVANNQSLTVALGDSAALLVGHTLGGIPATLDNMSLAVTSSPLPAGISVNNGRVAVANDATAGILSLGYRICELANANNCANVTVQLTIPPAPIVANADSFSLSLDAAGSFGDVLSNDTLAGTPATAARVIVVAAAALPPGIDLSTSGRITLTSGAAAGSHEVAYRICQTSLPTNCANGSAIVTVPNAAAAAAVGSVSGRIIDADTGLGVSGVRVALGAQAALSTTTDGSGAFALNSVPADGRVTMLASHGAYADGAAITVVTAERNSVVHLRLVKASAAVELPAATGGTSTLPGSPASFSTPAASLQDSSGIAASGAVRVQLTPIPPTSDSSVIAGDYTTLAGGAVTPIEVYGAMHLRLQDGRGGALSLRTGQTAALRIPVATRSDTLPLALHFYSFDTASGRWLQEGPAHVAGAEPNYYYEGSITHGGLWIVGQAMDSVRVTGCLVDANGARVAGARIVSDGVDYSAAHDVVTDSAGNFSIGVRVDSQATLSAQAGGVLSNTDRVGPFTVNASLPSCLTLGMPGASASVKLTWGERIEDLDAHLLAPDGSHIAYDKRGSAVSAPFAALDVDDVSSFGPEVITVSRLMVGTYRYAVHNFEGQAAALFSTSLARVELNLPGRAPELFVLPTRGESAGTDWWQLFEFDVDAACNVTVRRISSFADAAPSASPARPAQFCNRTAP